MTVRTEAPPGARAGALPAVPGEAPARVPDIVVWGAHGGAGTSTLATLLRAAGGGLVVRELLRACPGTAPAADAAAKRIPAGLGGRMIVTARGNAAGALRAELAVSALARAGVRPAVLAVIADGAGPLPRLADGRLSLLSDRIGSLVIVPFAAVLRATGDPAACRLPAGLRQAVERLTALTAGAEGGDRS